MALQGVRRQPRCDVWTFASLLGAFAGVACWGLSVFVQMRAGWWPAGLSSTILISVAATLAIFTALCLRFREAWRLTGLVGIHSLVAIAVAAVWQHAPDVAHAEGVYISGWVAIHIATAIPTYALVTLAAISALAAFLQQLALKQKRPRLLTRGLPALADCDELQLRLLQLGELVLAFGLLTGMALEYVTTGQVLNLNHKVILTLSAFFVIGALLIAHQRIGLRGRRAAQLVLLGYLLLTLGFPGVKFVTDVLLTRMPSLGLMLVG
jgi:ABC-type uncharacterized transport system, permease component